jgi:hypothetical protein
MLAKLAGIMSSKAIDAWKYNPIDASVVHM